jgi:hypothetical protein
VWVKEVGVVVLSACVGQGPMRAGWGGGGADNKVVGPYWWGCHELRIIHVEPQATHLHVRQGV